MIAILCTFLLLLTSAAARVCDFPIVDAEALEPEEFETLYFRSAQPALFTNAAKGWKAYEKWKWERLPEAFGNETLRVGPGPYPTAEMSIKDYLQLVSSLKLNESKPNIFQYGQVPTSWTLWSHKEECIPYVAFLHDSSKPLHDNTTFVCEEILRNIKVPKFLVGNEDVRKPPAHITHSGLLIGVPGSGIDFHSHQDAINVVLHGRKQWYMKVHPGVITSKSCESLNDTVCSAEKGILAHKLGVDVTEEDEKDTIVATCTQFQGEVMYIPDGIQHGVINLENSVAMQMQWPVEGWNNEKDREMYKAYLLHAVDPEEPDPSIDLKDEL